MLIQREGNKIHLKPQKPIYIKVVVETYSEIVLSETFLDSEKIIPLTYVGRYKIFYNDTGVFSDRPEQIFENYEPVINVLVEEYFNLFCPCGECKPLNLCKEENTSKTLCYFNNVFSFLYLFPDTLSDVSLFISKYFNTQNYNNVINNFHNLIYLGDENCCSKEVNKIITILLLSSYHIFRKSKVYSETELNKMFRIDEILKCAKNNNICLNGIFDEYNKVVITPEDPIKIREAFFYGDIKKTPSNMLEITDWLSKDYISTSKQFSFINDEKRFNTIIIPKKYSLNEVITSNLEHLKDNFKKRDVEIIINGKDEIWDMYIHSSVLPLNLTINFKLKNNAITG